MLPDSAYVVVDSSADQLSASCTELSPWFVELLDPLLGELNLRLYQHVRPPFGFGVRKLDLGLYL